MKHDGILTITPLLSILLMSFHHVDDVVRGFAPPKFSNLVPIIALGFWLCTTLLLAGRKSGYIITLVFSFLSLGLPIIHMTRAGVVGGRVANSSGAFFFVWTLIMIGIIAVLSVVLAVRALLRLRVRNSVSSQTE